MLVHNRQGTFLLAHFGSPDGQVDRIVFNDQAVGRVVEKVAGVTRRIGQRDCERAVTGHCIVAGGRDRQGFAGFTRGKVQCLTGEVTASEIGRRRVDVIRCRRAADRPDQRA